MSDIVAELNRYAKLLDPEAAGVMEEAAAEIEKLRAALKPCVDYFSWNGGLIRDEEYEAAAAALKETGDD